MTKDSGGHGAETETREREPGKPLFLDRVAKWGWRILHGAEIVRVVMFVLRMLLGR